MLNCAIKRLLPVVLLSCMLLSLLGFIGAEKAYACSCVMPGTYKEEMEKSSHVLDATVVEKTELESGKIDVELSVSASWKGTAEREMHVITTDNSAACGYMFNIGTRYAVFANEIEGELHVSLCSATMPLSDASDIFKELGEPEKLDDEPQVEPPDGGKGDKDQAAAPEASAGPTANTVEVTNALSPDQIKKTVTKEELVNKIDTQHSSLMIVFIVTGVLFIVVAAFLFLSRRKR